MKYDQQIEKVTIEGEDWTKVRGDNAFAGVLRGWKDYQKVFDEYLIKRNIVVQAGGYCGCFPRKMSKMFNLVYTFEPDPLNFYCLVQNCQEDNILKAQAALGEASGRAIMPNPPHGNRGMGRSVGNHDGVVPMYRIDDLHLTDCNLIMLDVEGYEHSILSGATDTIFKFRPIVSVEDTNAHIVEFLSNFEYREIARVHRDTIYVRQT